jgi:small subunit ribosomal protein S8
VKPRFAVKVDGFENWEKKFLPSRDVGLMVVSTSQGVLAHRDAEEKSLGGRLLAFVY